MQSYKLVYADCGTTDDYIVKDLEKKVNALLDQGWTCLGGVVISFNDNGHIIRMYQTMLKNELTKL